MTTLPDRPVKGSWEDLLETADQFSANYNDEAIPIYRKIVTRLDKMPAARRHAAGGRLQEIYLNAAMGLVGISLMREHDDEALNMIEKLIAASPHEEKASWLAMRRSALVQAGRPDEALTELRAIAQGPGGDLEDRAQLGALQSQLLRYDEFTETIGEMERWISGQYGDERPEARVRDEAVVEISKSMHQAGLQEWQPAIGHYMRAIELDQNQREMLPTLYLDLLLHGEYETAIHLIRRDQQSQVRPNFWLGYALHQMGNEDEAVKHWVKALDADLDNEENRQYLEYFLAAFYMEDRRDGALSVVLEVIQDGESHQWPLFFLAGLGWALRGDINTARADLEVSLLQSRAALDGRLLPYEFWIHLEALLPADMQEQLAEYFATDIDTATDGRTVNRKGHNDE